MPASSARSIVEALVGQFEQLQVLGVHHLRGFAGHQIEDVLSDPRCSLSVASSSLRTTSIGVTACRGMADMVSS